MEEKYTNDLYVMLEKAKKYDELLKFSNTPFINCSFCGKSQEQVEKLIAGPHVYICNYCVSLCNDIFEEESNSKLN